MLKIVGRILGSICFIAAATLAIGAAFVIQHSNGSPAEAIAALTAIALAVGFSILGAGCWGWLEGF